MVRANLSSQVVQSAQADFVLLIARDFNRGGSMVKAFCLRPIIKIDKLLNFRMLSKVIIIKHKMTEDQTCPSVSEEPVFNELRG